MNMLIKFRNSESTLLFLAFFSIAIIFIFGCNLLKPEPSEEIIQKAINSHCTPVNAKDDYKLEITNFKIMNKYRKEIDNETVFIYETQFTQKTPGSINWTSNSDTLDEVYTLSLVKRGDSWYFLRVIIQGQSFWERLN